MTYNNCNVINYCADECYGTNTVTGNFRWDSLEYVLWVTKVRQILGELYKTVGQECKTCAWYIPDCNSLVTVKWGCVPLPWTLTEIKKNYKGLEIKAHLR